MLDPGLGLSTISSWTPVIDMATNAVTSVTAVASAIPDDDANQPYFLRLFVKLRAFYSWLTERCMLYARLTQEEFLELREEGLVRSHPTIRASLPTSSPFKPPLPGTPKTFPQFNRLPAELRQQIWTEALPGPRLLILRLPDSSRGTDSDPDSSSFTSTFRPRRRHPPHQRRSRTRSKLSPQSSSRKPKHPDEAYRDLSRGPKPPSNALTCPVAPPTLLQVNSESRAVALRHYRPGLIPDGRCHSSKGYRYYRVSPTYVDFSCDVIGLSDALLASAEGRELLRRTPDLSKARHFCFGSGSGARVYLCGEDTEGFATASGISSGGSDTSGGGVGSESGRRRKNVRWLFEAAGIEDVAVVDSLVFAEGLMPRVAALDWTYWIRWQCALGKARWAVLNGEGQEEGVNER